jgi:hypothetical protein
VLDPIRLKWRMGEGELRLRPSLSKFEEMVNGPGDPGAMLRVRELLGS